MARVGVASANERGGFSLINDKPSVGRYNRVTESARVVSSDVA